MPSPVGHSLAGLAVARVVGIRNPAGLLGTVAAANLADLDSVVGVLTGQGPHVHGGVTHSLGAALLCGAAAGGIGLMRGHGFGRAFSAGLGAYASHVALDYLGKTPEGSLGGIPVWWPLSRRRTASRHPVFRTIKALRGKGLTLGSFLNRNNRRAVRHEVRVLLPVVLAAEAIVRLPHVLRVRRQA